MLNLFPIDLTIQKLSNIEVETMKRRLHTAESL